MNLRGRLAKLTKVVASRPRADQIHILEWIRAGTSGAEGRPPGEYQTGNVVEMVYAGDEPDPVVLARVHARMPPWALTIQFGPEFIPPPTKDP